VYLFDAQLRTTTLVTHSFDDPDEPAGDWPGNVSISADGRVVAYEEISDVLVEDDSNDTWDVFAYDVASGVNQLVSRAVDGDPGNGESASPGISAGATFVAFSSAASDLVSDDANGVYDVFVADLSTGTIVLASRNPNGDPANGFSAIPSVSADGTRVAFSSTATDLLPDEPSDGSQHTYLRDLATETTQLVTRSWRGGFAGVGSGFGPLYPMITEDGRLVAHRSDAYDLVRDDGNETHDAFVYRSLRDD
jgi:Tol biopolymer transport system component